MRLSATLTGSGVYDSKVALGFGLTARSGRFPAGEPRRESSRETFGDLLGRQTLHFGQQHDYPLGFAELLERTRKTAHVISGAQRALRIIVVRLQV